MLHWISVNLLGLLGSATGIASLLWQYYLYRRNKPELNIEQVTEFPSYWISESDVENLNIDILSETEIENRLGVITLEIQNKRPIPVTVTGIKVTSLDVDGNIVEHRINRVKENITFSLPKRYYYVRDTPFIEELRMANNFKFPFRLNSYDAIRGTFIIIFENSNTDTIKLNIKVNTPYKDQTSTISLKNYKDKFIH